MSTSDQSANVPVEVRAAVRDWVTGTYGLANQGVPVHLIEKVDLAGQTIYRVEADVKDITKAPGRAPVYMDVIARTGAPFEIDPDSVVFFDSSD